MRSEELTDRLFLIPRNMTVIMEYSTESSILVTITSIFPIFADKGRKIWQVLCIYWGALNVKHFMLKRHRLWKIIYTSS